MHAIRVFLLVGFYLLSFVRPVDASPIQPIFVGPSDAIQASALQRTAWVSLSPSNRTRRWIIRHIPTGSLKKTYAGFWIPLSGTAFCTSRSMGPRIRQLLKATECPEQFIEAHIKIDSYQFIVWVHQDWHREMIERSGSVLTYFHETLVMREKQSVQILKGLHGKRLILDVVDQSPHLYGNHLNDGYLYRNTIAMRELDQIALGHELLHEAGVVGATPLEEAELARIDQLILQKQGFWLKNLLERIQYLVVWGYIPTGTIHLGQVITTRLEMMEISIKTYDLLVAGVIESELITFFKWFYSPTIPSAARYLRRMFQNIYLHHPTPGLDETLYHALRLDTLPASMRGADWHHLSFWPTAYDLRELKEKFIGLQADLEIKNNPRTYALHLLEEYRQTSPIIQPPQTYQDEEDFFARPLAANDPFRFYQFQDEPIHMIKFKNPAIQNVMMARLRFFVETRPGEIGADLEAETFFEYDAHIGDNYQLTDMARFFNWLSLMEISLNAYEAYLLEYLLNEGLLRNMNGTYLVPREGAILAIPEIYQNGQLADASRRLYRHEFNHGVYFVDFPYFNAAQQLWADLIDHQQKIRNLLSHFKVYNFELGGPDLLIREFIAYFHDQDEFKFKPFSDAGKDWLTYLHDLVRSLDRESAIYQRLQECFAPNKSSQLVGAST